MTTIEPTCIYACIIYTCTCTYIILYITHHLYLCLNRLVVRIVECGLCSAGSSLAVALTLFLNSSYAKLGIVHETRLTSKPLQASLPPRPIALLSDNRMPKQFVSSVRVIDIAKNWAKLSCYKLGKTVVLQIMIMAMC